MVKAVKAVKTLEGVRLLFQYLALFYISFICNIYIIGYNIRCYSRIIIAKYFNFIIVKSMIYLYGQCTYPL